MESRQDEPPDGVIHENPFSPEAMATAARLLSTEQDRAEVAQATAALSRDGYCVIEGVLGHDQLMAVRGEVDRLNAETPASTSSFGGFETRRAFNLLGRSRVFDPLVTNRLVVAAVEAHLDDQIQLSEASTVTLEPGQRAQVLHHDDGCYPMPRPHLPLMVSAMLAVDDFTGANGATRVVPGSHLIAEVDSVVQIMQACETTTGEGSSIMMFPEGTRSMDGDLQPFTPGAFKLALTTCTPILPIVIFGSADALPKRGIVLQGRHPIRIRGARSGSLRMLSPTCPSRSSPSTFAN